MGCTIDIHATLEDTGNTSLTEVCIPPYFPGAPPHLHEHMTESFYVLEGNLDVLHDGKWTETRRGDFFLIPPRMAHGYRNSTGQPARFLIMGPVHARYYSGSSTGCTASPSGLSPMTMRSSPLVAFTTRSM